MLVADFDVVRDTVLAVIQGLTEFLPVSSSAHLILPSELLGWEDQGLNFDVALHFGSLIAVLLYYRKDLLQLGGAMLRQMTQRQDSPESRLSWHLVLATIPAAIVGKLFEHQVETTFRSVHVIVVTTLFYGVLLGIADRTAKQNRGLHELTWRTSLMIGLAQMLALVPGTSRSGITMTAALFSNLKRADAARFSFLMSIPIIGGGAVLKLVELLRLPDVNWSELGFAALVAGVTAYLCIHYFLKLITNFSFMPFVIYRVLLGLALLAIVGF
ncbi:MAG TPA: undecaprenyl-diphosphate phosphatase [Candidatus Acidoferrum sp.]|nr:undecaprenyl-diphosphate phosphatase [Candidatus Acidoferrum sp.]